MGSASIRLAVETRAPLTLMLGGGLVYSSEVLLKLVLTPKPLIALYMWTFKGVWRHVGCL
jgi:hypothetical protein